MSNNIKKIRESKKISRKELAKMVGTTYATIQRFETNERNVSFKWLEKIAEALSCSKTDLISDHVDEASLQNKIIIEEELLAYIIEKIEEYLRDNNITNSPEHKAKLIAFCCNHVSKAQNNTGEYKALLNPSILSLFNDQIRH